jgi:hypothetical protein
MRRLHLLAVLLLLGSILVPREAVSAYQFTNVSETPGISIFGSVAPSGGPATMVAWQEGSGSIRTRLLSGDTWQSPINHGAGTGPVLAWGRSGVILAYASGTDVVVREGNGSAWSAPIHLGCGEAVSDLDLTCTDDPAVDLAYLVWETPTGKLYFASRSAAGWSAPEMARQVGNVYAPLEPQVAPILSGSNIVPRLYYLDLPNIWYVDRVGAGWSTPSMVPTLPSAGTDFEVAVGPDLRHYILSLGLQPS